MSALVPLAFLLLGGACPVVPEARPEETAELLAEHAGAIGPAAQGRLRLSALAPDRVLIVASDPALPAPTMNGGRRAFDWVVNGDLAAIIVEGCGFDAAALSVTAGSAFGDLTGPAFFQARPDTLAENVGVISHEFESAALGATRTIYVMQPEGWNGAAGDPLVLSGDALANSPFGRVVATLSQARFTRPVAFASARFGTAPLDGTPANRRSAEYVLPGDEDTQARHAAYAAHEAFFFEEFLPFVVAELGGETGPVYTFGISASATFALEQGLMRPDVIDGVIAGSPVLTDRTRSLAASASAESDITLWCGDLEDYVCVPLAEFAREHAIPLEIRRAAHANALWEEAIAASLIARFPPREP